MERKHSPQHIKRIDGRTVTGIFSVFGNLDSYNDVVWPGAFSKTMQERGSKIVHLWQHDMAAPPIAKITNLRELTRAELPSELLRDFPEASGGAEVTREYLDTPRGNEILATIKAGVPLQMSFAFDALKYDFAELPGAKHDWEQQRNVREVRLWETSDVLWGANEATVAAKADPHVLLRQLHGLLIQLNQIKAGSRHSASDVALINQIAETAHKLGATNISLLETIFDEAAESRAAAPALTRSASRQLYLVWQERQQALREAGVFV